MDTINYYIERIEKASEKLFKRLESEKIYLPFKRTNYCQHRLVRCCNRT